MRYPELAVTFAITECVVCITGSYIIDTALRLGIHGILKQSNKQLTFKAQHKIPQNIGEIIFPPVVVVVVPVLVVVVSVLVVVVPVGEVVVVSVGVVVVVAGVVVVVDWVEARPKMRMDKVRMTLIISLE